MKKLLKRFCLGFLNELKEWKVILLIVLMFVVAFKSPSQYKDFIAIAVFVIYSAIIFFFLVVTVMTMTNTILKILNL
jgi:hypothetical protein